MMNREKSSFLGLYTIGIAALFLVGFLLLIVFGAQVYSDSVSGQDENNRTRALRSYLVTCTQAAGAEDVEVRDGGQVLVIRDSGTAYGLRIYLHEGQLMEQYSRLDADLDPEKAQPIAATKSFTAEQLEPDVFAVVTDGGRTLLHVESAADRGKGPAAGENPAPDEGGEAQ